MTRKRRKRKQKPIEDSTPAEQVTVQAAVEQPANFIETVVEQPASLLEAPAELGAELLVGEGETALEVLAEDHLGDGLDE
jgi:hypothetical protein